MFFEILESTKGSCNLPVGLAETIGKFYNVLLAVIPGLIVLFGVVDFLKSVSSGKSDEISKNTSTFIRRLITGLVAFFILAAVKYGLGLIKTKNTSDALNCLNSIVGNKK